MNTPTKRKSIRVRRTEDMGPYEPAPAYEFVYVNDGRPVTRKPDLDGADVVKVVGMLGGSKWTAAGLVSTHTLVTEGGERLEPIANVPFYVTGA